MAVVEYACLAVGESLRTSCIVLAVGLVEKGCGLVKCQIGLGGLGKVVVDVGTVFLQRVAHFMQDVEAKPFAIGNKAVGTRHKGAIQGQVTRHGKLKDGIVDREFKETDAVTHHLVGENAVWEVVNVVGGSITAQAVKG